jgi:hypothetical protein
MLHSSSSRNFAIAHFRYRVILESWKRLRTEHQDAKLFILVRGYVVDDDEVASFRVAWFPLDVVKETVY